MPKSLCIALLLILNSSSVWAAAADSDALQRFGLLGHWALDCKRLPGKSNVYYGYVASPNGFPIQTEQGYYENETVVSELHDVRIISNTSISFTSIGSNTLYITVLKEGRRHRTWSSKNKNGTVYVTDGVQGGAQTSWFEKCDR